MVTTILANNTRISANASGGDLRPKKSNDHRTFNASWVPNATNAPILVLRLVSGKRVVALQTRNNDTPITIYSVVQTGPKIQSGGVSDGFSSVRYHVEIDSEVKMDAMEPASRGTPTEITIRSISFLDRIGNFEKDFSLPTCRAVCLGILEYHIYFSSPTNNSFHRQYKQPD